MRRRLALPIAVLAWLALAVPASAAPKLTVKPSCDNPAQPYAISVGLTGVEPNSRFDWSGGGASATFTADANGSYGPLVLIDVEPSLWTFTVTLPSGEQLIESAMSECGDRNGGSVIGEGLTDQGVRFTIAARSDQDQSNPAGTVTERLAGHDLRGSITCLSANGPYAAVGVAIENPPPGVSPGQLILISDRSNEDRLGIESRATAPTTCPLPVSPHNGVVTEGGLAVQEAAPDSEPPEIHLPDLALVNATRPRGARISYVAWASDNLDPLPSIECSPPRGIWLTQPWTTITCTSSDYSGNTTTRSIRLVLIGVVAQLQMLEDVVNGYGLDDRTARRLTFELRQARRAYRSWWPRPACTWLARFVSLASRESGHGLTPQQAGRVLADAQRIRGAAGCVPPPPPARAPRITLTESCNAVEQPDYSRFGDYGISVELDGFAPNAEVSVHIDTEVGGAGFDATTDDEGHYGPWLGVKNYAVGQAVATATLKGSDTVLATASVDDPCVAPVYAP